MRVAITGGIACGKSLFSHYLRQQGMAILDADEVTHALEAPAGVAVSAIREAFGSCVVDASGGIDRCALAAIIFADSAARERLNKILHPMVKDEVERWLNRSDKTPRAVVIPLLFEVGWNGGWDVVICVACSEAEQMRRLMCDRGMTEAQARARIASQMPVSEKAKKAQIVVNNDADAEALAREAERVFRLLTERSE